MAGVSVVEDAQIPRHDLVFKNGTGRDVYARAVVSHNDDGSLNEVPSGGQSPARSDHPADIRPQGLAEL